MTTPLIYHSDFAGYDFGANHPFRGERFARFISELEHRFPEVFSLLEIVEPEPASFEQIQTAHTPAYIERVLLLEKRRGFLSPDTQVLPGSVDSARLIVGGTIKVVNEAMSRKLAIGFGGLHHAGPDYGEGFCIFNDIAVAAVHLLKEGLDRVMIIDTDAHQGNGTMDIFYREKRVLFISLHQDPLTLYPGRGFIDEIGSGDGAGFTVNIPMPPLSTGEMYRYAMEEIVLPLIEAYKPQIIIRNGGSDPLYTDTLTNLGLDMGSLSKLTGSIARKASELDIPLADLFLSGYGPYVTEGWLAILRGTLGLQFSLEEPEEPLEISKKQLKRMKAELTEKIKMLKLKLKDYWDIF